MRFKTAITGAGYVRVLLDDRRVITLNHEGIVVVNVGKTLDLDALVKNYERASKWELLP